jgi:hypothetical protein
MSYPWKKSPELLPDNYSQVLKKMESTERRLSKQPAHAKSYDEQMQEMERMQFSRKLTKDEIKDWKGPVHYITLHYITLHYITLHYITLHYITSHYITSHHITSHHITLHYLISNLFEVVIRFREKEVAVVRDISKVYHRIAIPLSDEDVHRNVETDQETNVCVKTIEIIDIECVLLSFLSKNLSPQNGGLIRAFWLVPDSRGGEFGAVAGSTNCFYNCKVCKNFISRLKMEKKFYKVKKVSKNPF